MTALQERLFSMRDEAYREFSARLVPNVPAESVVGVRVPEIRRLSVEIGEGERAAFMAGLPHEFHEENLLHAFCVERVRGFGPCVAEVERFLPFATNWAVTDSCNPRALASAPDALLGRVRAWLGSDWPYTVRFALLSLMRHFLDARFSPAVLGFAASVRPEDYYVRMIRKSSAPSAGGRKRGGAFSAPPGFRALSAPISSPPPFPRRFAPSWRP